MLHTLHSDAALTLETIARSASESVRPDLWRGLDVMLCPALGRSGAVLHNLRGGTGPSTIASAVTWGADGLVFPDHSVSNAYVTLNGTVTATGRVTVVADVTPGPVDSFRNLLSFNNSDNQIAFQSNGSIRTRWAAGGSFAYSNAGAVMEGKRTCVISVFDGTAYSIYVDGLLVGIADGSSTTTVSSGQILGMKRTSYNGENFGGTVHSIGISGTIFNASQVRDLSADPMLPLRRRVPVFYWIPSGATAYEVACTFAASAGITPTAAAEAMAGMSVGSTLGAAVLASAGAQASMSAGMSAGEVLNATAEAAAALSGGLMAAMSTTVSSSLNVGLTLGVEAGLTVAGSNLVTVGLTAGASLGGGMWANAAALPALTMDAELGYAIVAAASAQAGLSADAIQSLTVTATAVVADLVTPDGRTITVTMRGRTITCSPTGRTIS